MATGRTPPRFVPTLTEVVQGPPAAPAPAAAVPHQQMVDRVLQRVDLVLDRRLREAIAAVVVEHTHALTPLLRERIDAVVRDVVAEAVAEEMRARQRTGGTPV
jgi:FixJ family two-component response regulator